jgi:hypothetical protein
LELYARKKKESPGVEEETCLRVPPVIQINLPGNFMATITEGKEIIFVAIKYRRLKDYR